MNHIRILIADDHPMFRRGLRALLQSLSGFEVVSEATTGQEAIALAAELQRDVVLMDLQMPEGSGIVATREIVQANPDIHILVITLFEDDDSVFMALRAGARGYVLKDADDDEIVRAIRAVSSGEAIFSPAVASRVLSFLTAPRLTAPKELFPSLTDRERQILGLLAHGDDNTKIAKQLSLSPKTVSNYVSNIFGKLQVADRAEAIVKAREAGLG
jgi:DNA-binding NarL/FixJ family response regulator